tara:strand:+ start:2384 stop:2938 length:555 start_codon:yes stop_codon:yes gene_type:complete
MPYTQEELDSGNVEFYTNFRGKLRGEYLERVQRSAEQNFRDENNTLYSFEDILTGDGVESVNIDEPSSIYKGVLTEQQRTQQSSKSKKEVDLYTQDVLLDRVVDRGFTELKEILFAEELPAGIENGDLLSSNNPDDPQKYLVDNNQRRLFPDLSTIFASGFDFSRFKTVDISIIKQIPEGEMVD